MLYLKLLCIFALLNISNGISTPDSPSYVAGVVEYLVDQGRTNDTSLTSAQIFKLNTDKYVEIMSAEEAANVDIIVFPENTLNRQDTAVVLPKENDFHLVDICTNTTFDENIRSIACAAKNLKKYVVINVTTKRNCVEEREDQIFPVPCTDERNLYNTNVVFNRVGVIISTYRKYNLFGEAGITQPGQIEYKTFETDFGVTFGHFICFDLLFESPAMSLVKNGITNIIFPTRWYSGLSFTTAVQVQQNWAYVNNVNLLAAGANLPSLGTTGSGIYSGKLGSFASIITGEETTKLLVHEVPKIPGSEVEMTSPIYTGANFDNLTLYPDEFDNYSSMRVLILGQVSLQLFRLCSTFQEEEFCCDFVITNSNINMSYTPYTYMAVAYNGWRHFNYHTYEGIKLCAVVSCESEDVLTCGKRFSNTPSQGYDFRFERISINGIFPSSQILTMPSTLDFNVFPLHPSKFLYEEIPVNGTGLILQKNITMSLQEANSELLTFGIYARDFQYSSKHNPNSGENIETSILLIILPIIFYIFNNLRVA